jgi:hypothetical protein
MCMKTKVFLAFWALCLMATPAFAQYSVSQPSGTTKIKAADDFATRAFQDPWDMSQRTDVGWWTFGKDTAAAGNFLNPTVSGGVFTGSLSGAAATLFLLESGLAPTPGGSATPIGKTGQQFPIDANTYTHLVYRMNSTAGGVSQYVWSQGTIYTDQTIACEFAQNATAVRTGWKIYDIDLKALSLCAGSQVPWAGAMRAFQFIPLAGSPSGTIQIDWARLVHADPKQTISWTGGAADIYLDTNNTATDGTLGRIAVNVTSPYSFLTAGLPAGTYYVAVHAPTAGEIVGSPATASSFFYSPGSWQVNDIPTIQFTTPSDEGSSDDFATTKLGDPWDFASMNDIDSTLPGFPGKENIASDAITSLTLTNEAGVNLGPQIVYLAASTPVDPSVAGDPQIFTLFWDGKGKATRIDPTRYRILTIDGGIPNLSRSLPAGSIGRVVWRAANEPVLDSNGSKVQTVGEHWAMNSAAGENTMAHISIDMNKMPVEPHSADTGTTWNSATAAGGLDGFRFDPHEFSPSTQFFIKRIKLAALERSRNSQFTFRWTLSEPANVTIFYDLDSGHTFTTGSVACQVVSAPAGAGSCLWNTAGVPDAEYNIYAKIDDGTNTNQVYAPTNVIVAASNTGPQMTLNRTQLNFSVFGAVRTQAQTVRLTFTGPGAAGQCWTATPNLAGLLAISPPSGCGSAAISIAATGGFPIGTTTVLVTIQPGTNPLDARTIEVRVTGLTTTSGPAGAFDTPADGAVLAGSVPVTGWAADDVEVTAVAICRDPVGSEGTTPPQCGGQNQVFIGNGTFSDDARPDIQAAFPDYPFNYRAGWGYLMLTNGLPNGGNGTYRLWAYATDRDGHTALLGSKMITGANATAVKPFGSIDRPQQGEVVCGNPFFLNAGWVLTQRPNDVPADSHTVFVFVDNVNLGNLQPGRLPRSDIDASFSPTYDTSHAAGGFFLDTTTLSNGVHTIFWVATDTGGNTDGIGSRFFTVSNPCGG